MNVIPAPTLTLQTSPALDRAILEALIYSDIFEHPLRLHELHRYLPLQADLADLSAALESRHELVRNQGDIYFLAGREEIVELRKGREERSRKLMPYALRYGRILGTLPFVRMVGLTGSLAVLNVSKNADFDYMLVTATGRVWTARAFALLLNRGVRRFGHVICPNLIVSETSLEWPLHDLYSARELCQMIPMAGMDVYQKVLAVNAWARDILPNAFDVPDRTLIRRPTGKRLSLKKILEFLLRSKPGNHLEQWEMTRKIARFSKQPGFGEETIFTAEVCQGNFHHHRKWTREVFEQRLLELESTLPKGDREAPRRGG